MSATQTETAATEAGSPSITELRRLRSRDAEAPAIDEAPAETEVVRSEPATPILKLVLVLLRRRQRWHLGYATTFTGWLLAAFLAQAAGMTLQDAHSNAFVAGLRRVPHRWLGFIHACYALGVEGWRRVYFVMIAICVLNVAGVAVAFRDTLWSSSRPRHEENYNDNGGSGGGSSNSNNNSGAKKRNRDAVKGMARILRTRTFWLLGLFYFFTLGAGMTAVRGGDLGATGYVPTGMYGGMLAGRLLLVEFMFPCGERRTLCVALQLVFWLQPNIHRRERGRAELYRLLYRAFFATGMSVASKLFARKDQPAALGLIFVIAQAGGAIFPSVTGLIATRAGVAVLQPIVLALFVAGGISWWLVPKVPQRDE
ncbi:MFS general substrate transporter [Annulohypoxylon truncatum]|uniref:MFS general substrate transporter n=1 Tax=Annulohypoxylon truncatum TaxID=327061 RepID=UPI00200756F6|nr:MFS general substrate transporter [Annulohypoxylon truncatum]KAI1214896.1 MFS general substrate transporter [Annulohypoxylon truncatum]